MAATKIATQAYFVHDRLLSSLLPADRDPELQSLLHRAEQSYNPAVARANVFERLLDQLLPDADQLEVLLEQGVDLTGRLVSLTQAIYFQHESTNVAFQAVSAAHPDLRFAGRLTKSRCVGESGPDLLRGRRRVTMLAYVDQVTADEVTLVPAFVGRQWDRTHVTFGIRVTGGRVFRGPDHEAA